MDAFSQGDHHVFVHNKYASLEEALLQASHVAIGAHPDDLEVMAGHGILAGRPQKSFVGITCTTGGGSPRGGDYSKTTNDELVATRRQEQLGSARQGDYGAMIQLGFTSDQIKSGFNTDFLQDLKSLLSQIKTPEVYTHNLFDKHLTHIAVVSHVIAVLREQQQKPQALWGCEVWRGLDWLHDKDKKLLPVAEPQLIEKLINSHRSQTESGKDYGAATVGRMKANATFFDAYTLDQCEHGILALDMMPLLRDENLSLVAFAQSFAAGFGQTLAEPLSLFQTGGSSWKL